MGQLKLKATCINVQNLCVCAHGAYLLCVCVHGAYLLCVLYYPYNNNKQQCSVGPVFSVRYKLKTGRN